MLENFYVPANVPYRRFESSEKALSKPLRISACNIMLNFTWKDLVLPTLFD